MTFDELDKYVKMCSYLEECKYSAVNLQLVHSQLKVKGVAHL